MRLKIRPESLQILSGSWLKVIAILSMLVDHLALFYWRFNPEFIQPLFMIGNKGVNLYFLCRFIGRIAFPIFAFLVVEGFLHTRNRKRYGMNLLIFALLSEIPWNLVHTGHFFYLGQNVIFTLLMGYLGLCAIERFSGKKGKLAASLIGLLLLSIIFQSDYGCFGYSFILLLYVLRSKRLLQAVIGSCMLGTWVAGFAFIPINMYNGKRGFIKGPVGKYLFYLFYPTHILLIYYLRLRLMTS